MKKFKKEKNLYYEIIQNFTSVNKNFSILK